MTSDFDSRTWDFRVGHDFAAPIGTAVPAASSSEVAYFGQERDIAAADLSSDVPLRKLITWALNAKKRGSPFLARRSKEAHFVVLHRLRGPGTLDTAYISIKTLVLHIVIPFLLIFILFVRDPPQAVAQDRSSNVVAPTVLIQKNGLDTSSNPIDRLINIYGACSTIIRQTTGRCKTEEQLSLLVDTMPHDARGLSEALTALGAKCNIEKKRPIRVDCLYQKQVQIVGWVYGESKPRNIIYQNYIIKISATFNHGRMRQYVELSTPEKTK